MTLADMLRRVDDMILDRLFQPVADCLPDSLSAWAVGISCQLGSLLFQAVCVLAPVVLYGVSLGESVQAGLILICSTVIFFGFQRFQPLVKPGMMNPLRVLLRGLRLVALAFLLYDVLALGLFSSKAWLWDQLATVSQAIFVVGLYFMACQPRPPQFRRTASSRMGRGRTALSDAWQG